jgi:signal transduction histidine kinase
MEQAKKITTFFDSPERLPNEDILKEILCFKQNSLLHQMLEGFQELAVVINKNRQIVAFNSKALQAFGTEDYFSIIGKRVGEAINCIHSQDTDSGCGTSYFCRDCGAARAMKKTIEKEIIAEEECRISVSAEGAIVSLDFHVHTQALQLEENTYTLFTVRDISSNKRRETLERIFFHDVLNTVQAIKGLTEILPDLIDEKDKSEITCAIISSAKHLMHEIKSQSALTSAENGQLEADYIDTSVKRILEGVADLYENNPIYNDKKLSFSYKDSSIELTTDISLSIRSIGNLIKNALEASSKNEEVKVYFELFENEVAFRIYNYKVIPENVQRQLFQRSFSTKQSKGHGIGLYSVKLLVHQYLKGRVDFVSNETDRTVFSIYLPRNLNPIS